ncbi:hypothetical protein HAX54_023803, partial [Datura stramonium]|nr:hypothetical protein [Datura stramonium]
MPTFKANQKLQEHFMGDINPRELTILEDYSSSQIPRSLQEHFIGAFSPRRLFFLPNSKVTPRALHWGISPRRLFFLLNSKATPREFHWVSYKMKEVVNVVECKVCMRGNSWSMSGLRK